MKYIIQLLIISVLLICRNNYSQKVIQHYIYFNRQREKIHDSDFLINNLIKGAQLKYTWKELEPEKDKYNFKIIQDDLDFLISSDKALFIQIQDVSFDTTIINVPGYLLSDSIYNGGAVYQYQFTNDDETEYYVEGWVARRWDKKVAERFHKLLQSLGEQFDGKIAGINLPETAIGFGNKREMHPTGFTFEKYRDAIKENMKIARESFSKSIVIQYTNFMPGEYLPWNDHSYLRDLYEYAKLINVGMGGPDLLLYKKGQINNSYGFIKECERIKKLTRADKRVKLIAFGELTSFGCLRRAHPAKVGFGCLKHYPNSPEGQ